MRTHRSLVATTAVIAAAAIVATPAGAQTAKAPAGPALQAKQKVVKNITKQVAAYNTQRRKVVACSRPSSSVTAAARTRAARAVTTATGQRNVALRGGVSVRQTTRVLQTRLTRLRAATTTLSRAVRVCARSPIPAPVVPAPLAPAPVAPPAAQVPATPPGSPAPDPSPAPAPTPAPVPVPTPDPIAPPAPPAPAAPVPLTLGQLLGLEPLDLSALLAQGGIAPEALNGIGLAQLLDGTLEGLGLELDVQTLLSGVNGLAACASILDLTCVLQGVVDSVNGLLNDVLGGDVVALDELLQLRVNPDGTGVLVPLGPLAELLDGLLTADGTPDVGVLNQLLGTQGLDLNSVLGRLLTP